MINGIEKSEFLSFLNEKIEYKIRKANEYLESIEESIRSETKSTAGDKHDTTRELMQQERNKAAQNISHQLLAQKTIMELRKSKESIQIGFGSLVQTNRSWIYIGLSIGKVLYNDQDVLCVSPVSPIARAFESKTENEKVDFNGIVYSIEKVI